METGMAREEMRNRESVGSYSDYVTSNEDGEK